MKNKKWEEEKIEREAMKVAMERERRKMIIKKREQEKIEFYSRLEEAQKKLALAQDNFEQVLKRQQNEQKFSLGAAGLAKVIFLYIKILNDLNNFIGSQY